MNKKLLTIILSGIFILSSLQLGAQNKKWGLGLETGINISNSTEDTAPLKKGLPILLSAGLTVEYLVSNQFSLKSGLQFSAKGLDSKGEGQIGNMKINGKVNIRHNVLQLPLFATYGIKLKQIKLAIFTGPYFAYGISGKTKALGSINEQIFEKEVNTFGNAHILDKSDFGLGCGVVVTLNMFELATKYELGLKNIGNNNIMGGNLDYKNRIITITLGYKI